MDRDLYGISPLMCACMYGRLDNVKLLVAYGADVNEEPDISGRTPILCAARGRHIDVIKYLLREGADPLVVSNVGVSSLVSFTENLL